MGNPFRRLSIRYKLFYGYGAAFILAVVMGNVLLFLATSETLETNIEVELRNTTQTVLHMVKTTTDVAIRNYLRAMAEKNRDVVTYLYELSESGKITEAEAKKQAAKILLSQVIGTTGYIYCVDSAGIMRVHPRQELLGVDLSENKFISLQKIQKNGYLEYKWANPGELVERPKALYMTYFEPWDWIISASSYRTEFKELFKVDDFRERILSISFGKTGYSYIIDSKGNLIIHPKLEGTNIFESKDSSDRMFIKELCEKKNGKIIYPWQNPGESEPREKLVLFNYIPELDWIVASSSYLEEFYEPLESIGYISLVMVGLTLALIIPITMLLSTSITRPFEKLMVGFGRGADGDYSSRLDEQDGGEIGQLAGYYNRFMDRLQSSLAELERSEEKYRSIFENAAEGVFQTDFDGLFVSANPSLAKMLGYRSPQELLEGVTDARLQIYAAPEDRDQLLEDLKNQGAVFDREILFRRTDGSALWASLNVRLVKGEAGEPVLVEGFFSDITRRKESEQALRRAKEELEQRVMERTNELSKWIEKLERHNLERDLLHALGNMIQLCRTSEETYPIITNFLKKFFPGESSSLYVYDESQNMLKPVGEDGDRMAFNADLCWSIRQGKPYLSGGGSDMPCCSHIEAMGAGCHLCSPIIAHGEIIGLFIVHLDETEMKIIERKKQLASSVTDNLALALANLRLRETLRVQSIQDPLTRLYNRRFLEEALEKEVSRSRRHRRPFGVLMLDIDYFKKVNDTHGHDVGDQVLQSLGNYLAGQVRSEDIACRLGGEEFVLIVSEVSREQLVAKAEGMCAAIPDVVALPVDDDVLRITVSIGVALFPDDGDTAQSVLKAADEALYVAKEQGRNRVVTSGPDLHDQEA